MTIIISEISGNHSGDLGKAKELIAAAALAGCDMVKIQTYKPEDLNDPANNNIYEKCMIPEGWYPVLFEVARDYRIPLFSSVFAPWAIPFLEQFECPAYKIASPESTRLSNEVYEQLAQNLCNRLELFIVSAGRADLEYMRLLGADVVLYCKAGYPAILNDEDLLMASQVDGFSDHTDDLLSPLAMIGAGAQYIEKHFKLDDDCIDARFSLNPEQMTTLCRLAHK